MTSLGDSNVLSALGKPFVIFTAALTNRCVLFISQGWKKEKIRLQSHRQSVVKPELEFESRGHVKM